MSALYFLPQSEALERPSATLQVAEWGSHLSVSHRRARSPVAERKIFAKGEYPSSREALERPSATLRVAEWGIAARDIVCANYAYQSKRIYHLLAWQDTASGGMLHRAVERIKLACKRQGEKSSPKANIPLPILFDKLIFINYCA